MALADQAEARGRYLHLLRSGMSIPEALLEAGRFDSGAGCALGELGALFGDRLFQCGQCGRLSHGSGRESLPMPARAKRISFSITARRLIFKHCTTNYRPTAAELAELLHACGPAYRCHGERYRTGRNASQEHAGLAGVGYFDAYTCLFLLCSKCQARNQTGPLFSAKEYVAMKGRRPSIFLTSGDEKMQVAFAPLHRMWIDSLIREFLSLPEVAPGEITVRMFIDEMPVLGELVEHQGSDSARPQTRN